MNCRRVCLKERITHRASFNQCFILSKKNNNNTKTRKIMSVFLFIIIVIVTITLTTSVAVSSSASSTSCRFAPKYKTEDLLTNKNNLREEFLAEVLQWERNFVRTIGIDAKTKMTRDGQRLDYVTGLPFGPGHEFSAPSKESLHLALLVLALDTNSHKGIVNASIFFTPDEALDILETKFETYETFHNTYPGFGGYLPWYAFEREIINNVTTTVNIAPTWDWQNKCPLLDNGEMIWSLYALKYLLCESNEYPRYAEQHPKLVTRIRRQWDLVIENLIPMWYDDEAGELAAVVHLTNQSLPVSQNTYTKTGLLNDPYEGESASILFTLFSNATAEQKLKMWINKRPLLKSANLTTNNQNNNKNITTMRGWWFSSHERWLLSFLPYRQSDVYLRVFVNGERARTIFSGQRGSPGLYASVNGPIPVNDNNANFPYYSACGIQELAFKQVLHDDVCTGYGSFPTFLAGINKNGTTNNAHNARGVAAAFLHTYLSAPKMQNLFGATESTRVNGTEIAPLTTWDSKITTAVAILGGVVDIVEEGLRAEKGGSGDGFANKLEEFVSVIDREWGRVFGEDSLPGEDMDFDPPVRQFPKVLEDFTSCR